MRELVRNLREAQRQLEAARAERDARWQKLQTQLRSDAVRLLRQLEKAVGRRVRSRKRVARARESGRARRVEPTRGLGLGGDLRRAGERCASSACATRARPASRSPSRTCRRSRCAPRGPRRRTPTPRRGAGSRRPPAARAGSAIVATGAKTCREHDALQLRHDLRAVAHALGQRPRRDEEPGRERAPACRRCRARRTRRASRRSRTSASGR